MEEACTVLGVNLETYRGTVKRARRGAFGNSRRTGEPVPLRPLAVKGTIATMTAEDGPSNFEGP